VETGLKGRKNIHTVRRAEALRVQGGENWMRSIFVRFIFIWIGGGLRALRSWRWAERKPNQRSSGVTSGTRNVLIVGAGSLGHRIANYLEEHEMER
jgi:lactate dehydrogenase-like 2-hydroxyacid dehydrogenase